MAKGAPVQTGVTIIAEAGSNFRAGAPDDVADFARAVELLHVAADAGADCFKTQFWSNAAKVYTPGAGPISRMFDDLRLPAEWLPGLAAACKARGIEFMASVFHPDDVPIVDPHVKRHKIASYEMGYEVLVRACAATGKPLIMSTGAHTDTEVRLAALRTVAAGCTDLTLMHCTACYPAPSESLNLRAIGTVALSDPALAAGYSDHSAEWWTPIAAVALGATVIEKHFTLSRTLPGPDHAFALEPGELRQMVRAIRATEAMLGDGQKRVEPAEGELRRFAVRRVQALRNLVPGDPVIEGETVACLRPGEKEPGAWAGDFGKMRNRHLRVAIAAGEGVRLEDVE